MGKLGKIRYVLLLLIVAFGIDSHAQLEINSTMRIAEGLNGFNGTLDEKDIFGGSLVNIGDLDDDGVDDICVSAHQDDDGGSNRGAIWILFLNPDGSVKAEQKISDTQGGFLAPLDNKDRFGWQVDALGDFNGDGIEDIVVGADGDDDGGGHRGAIYILFLDTDGTVKDYSKISNTQGNFNAPLTNYEAFGRGVANIGDFDGNGTTDIAVGARGNDDGGSYLDDFGAVYLLMMDSVYVDTFYKISNTHGNFTGVLDSQDRFGVSIENLGDINNDGVTDIAVGARWDDDGYTDAGALYVLRLNANGAVKSYEKISENGALSGYLAAEDEFCWGVASGDYNGNGKNELLVGARLHDDGDEANQGIVYIFEIDTSGAPTSVSVLDTIYLDTALADGDQFGRSIHFYTTYAYGQVQLMVSAPGTDYNHINDGVFYHINLLDTTYEGPNNIQTASIPKYDGTGYLLVTSDTVVIELEQPYPPPYTYVIYEIKDEADNVIAYVDNAQTSWPTGAPEPTLELGINQYSFDLSQLSLTNGAFYLLSVKTGFYSHNIKFKYTN